MKTKYFIYTFSEKGFCRKERKLTMFIRFLVILLFVLACIYTCILTFNKGESIVFIIMLFLVLFFATLFIVLFIEYKRNFNKIANFDFSLNKISYVEQVSDLVENSANISDYDSIIYVCNLNKRKGEQYNSFVKRLNKKYGITVEINDKSININPCIFRDIRARLIKQEFKTTTVNILSMKFVGFYLFNSITGETVFIMESDKDKINDTFDYLIKNICPKQIITLENLNDIEYFKIRSLKQRV